MLRNDIDTERLVPRQSEMAHLSHCTNAYYWSGDGYLSGAVCSNVMLPDYGGSDRTHASAGQWKPMMAQCKSARHAHNDSQLQSCRAARNGLGVVYVLKSLTQYDSCWLHGSRFDYGYPIKDYRYKQLFGLADMSFATEA